MTEVALGPRSGWYLDPISPLERRRWWSGTGWTARVAAPHGPANGIAWHPDLADTPAPIRWFAPGYAPRPAAPITVAPPPAPTAPLAPVAPLTPVAPDLEPVPAPVVELPTAVDGPRRGASTRTKVAAALVAAAVLAFAAGGGAAILGDGGRPELEPVRVYRDPDAGFAVRYPVRWKVESDVPGRSIRFEISAKRADSLSRNHVSVVVTGGPMELPTLDRLVIDASAKLQLEFPGIRLQAADHTRLVGAPALELTFVDRTHNRPIRVRQMAGSLASGGQIVVTVTVREPRTAPTAPELREFLNSISTL